MAVNWCDGVLGDCITLKSGGTPSKSQPDFWEGSIPWASAKDMKRFWIEDAEDHLTESGASEASCIVQPGSTLLLVRGMTLHNDVPICRVRQPSAFNQDVKAVLPREGTDGEFVPYLLLGNKTRLLSIVDSAGHGTGRLNTDTLLQLPIRIPPLIEQQAIASICSALDDKIELNRRMNETLEAMAQAIFKSWFVDFDPVRAKAEGRLPTGMDPATAALFPDTFEDSPLGKIPKSWQIEEWRTLIALEYGKALRGYETAEGNYPVFGTNGQIGWHTVPLCSHPGIVIGRKGAYRGVHFSPTPFFAIDTAYFVEPRRPLDLRWAYYEMLRLDINTMDSGSAIPSTSRENIYGLRTVVPDYCIQEKFAAALDPIWTRQIANGRESTILSTIRDTVLPKLLSGEIRLLQAEKLVEAVT